jgi:hypothetical protein
MDELIATGQEPCVLDRHRGLVGQDLEESKVVVVERPRARGHQADHAADARLEVERHGQEGARAGTAGTEVGQVRGEHRDATERGSRDGIAAGPLVG